MLGEHDLIDVYYVMTTPDHSLQLPSALCPPFNLGSRVLRLPFLCDLDALPLHFLLTVDAAENANSHDFCLEPPIKMSRPLC